MTRRRVWLYLAVFLLVAALAGSVVFGFRLRDRGAVEIALKPAAPPPAVAGVYVSGAVANPGMYAINKGDTIGSLLQQAAPTAQADTSAVRVYVPSAGQAQSYQRVDVNRAEAWLLEALPGIGEVKAKAIIEFRMKNGLFKRPEDLLKVDGISQAVLDKMRELITVGE